MNNYAIIAYLVTPVVIIVFVGNWLSRKRKSHYGNSNQKTPQRQSSGRIERELVPRSTYHNPGMVDHDLSSAEHPDGCQCYDCVPYR